MNDFQLEKWYMDATDEKGRVFIGYAARLQWKSLKLHYNGYTFLPGKSSGVIKRNSFASREFPIEETKKLGWKFMDVRASWEKINDSVSETLLPDSEINWLCKFPKASASVSVGNEHMDIDALGYAENIKITIAPWKIPIRELHWGRFLSLDDSLVWIKWEGPVPKILVYYNNKRFNEGFISSEVIMFDNYSLELKNKQTLRKGSLLSTVFARFNKLAGLFPKNIMQLQENKWASDGMLKLNGKLISSGKAIHELVIWP